MNEKLKHLTIEVVSNGYIVHRNGVNPGSFIYPPFVFESFTSLTDWLSKNLDQSGNAPEEKN